LSTVPKIYTVASSQQLEDQKNLIPPFQHHWHALAKDEIRAGKGSSDPSFEITTVPEESDWFALPMHWSYYLWNGKARMKEALELAELAARHGRRVIVWYKGDLIPRIPFENYFLFLPGPRRSRMNSKQQACPVFVSDPAERISGIAVEPAKRSDAPSVGFCGYASNSWAKTLWSIFRGVELNMVSSMGLYDYTAVPILPATILRSRALRLLSQDPAIDDNFVIRERYCPGGGSAIDRGEITREFYRNIYQNNYTLCLRGYGNWSYRFYETLACGRVPVFVDTDCELPASSMIDWKKYCVWVNGTDLKNIGKSILDFHSKHSAETFRELQLDCRRLWEEHFTLGGFARHFHEYLPRS
jgi:hypothetical protein